MPVKEITYKGKAYEILKDKPCGDYAKKLFDYLNDIQYGVVKHKFQRKII
jgi:hypothetical protein